MVKGYKLSWGDRFKMGWINKYKKMGAYHWTAYKNSPSYKKHVDLILALFEHEDRGTILDVGCGDGLISYKLARLGFTVVGIDIEQTAIDLAKKEIIGRADTNVAFFVGDIMEMFVACDYLLASETIERLKSGDEFLWRISDMFTSKALITTPLKYPGKKKEAHHEIEYSQEEFYSMLEKVFTKDGFTIEICGASMFALIDKAKTED